MPRRSRPATWQNFIGRAETPNSICGHSSKPYRWTSCVARLQNWYERRSEHIFWLINRIRTIIAQAANKPTRTPYYQLQGSHSNGYLTRAGMMCMTLFGPWSAAPERDSIRHVLVQEHDSPECRRLGVRRNAACDREVGRETPRPPRGPSFRDVVSREGGTAAPNEPRLVPSDRNNAWPGA
jgi:hypothetical protein